MNDDLKLPTVIPWQHHLPGHSRCPDCGWTYGDETNRCYIPGCPHLSALVPVQEDTVRAEAAAHEAVLRFLDHIRPPQEVIFRATFAAGQDYEARSFVYPISGASARLLLREDWLERVHRRGLDRLPYPVGVRWIFVLDAFDAIERNDVSLVHAVWTRGNQTRHEGWLAYARNYWSGDIEVYATGTTAQRALNCLSRERKTRDAAILSRADADAIATVRFGERPSNRS